jgi:hypothetical protein
VPQRLQFRLADIDLQRLREIEAQVRPAHDEILRQELEKFWLQHLQALDHPVRIVLDERTVKNKAALVWEEEERRDHLSVPSEAEIFRRELQLKDTQILVLTEKLNELLKKEQETGETGELKETSLLLLLWKNLSAKPGIFGFSIDLKSLVTESAAVLRDRSRIIELGLNKP